MRKAGGLGPHTTTQVRRAGVWEVAERVRDTASTAYWGDAWGEGWRVCGQGGAGGVEMRCQLDSLAFSSLKVKQETWLKLQLGQLSTWGVADLWGSEPVEVVGC